VIVPPGFLMSCAASSSSRNPDALTGAPSAALSGRFALPGSRVSEPHKPTEDSTELMVRIHSPPAASHDRTAAARCSSSIPAVEVIRTFGTRYGPVKDCAKVRGWINRLVRT
jgi:hypothetical protein